MRKSLFVAVVLSLGCGSSSSGTGGPAECASFTPCGGSIVGTWMETERCSTIQPSSSSTCIPDVLVGDVISNNVQRDDTTTFANDGTYSIVSLENGTMTVAYLQRCMTAINETCAQFQASIDCGSTGLACGTRGFSASCSANAAGNCECIENFTNSTTHEDGTYTLSGNMLTMARTDSTTTPLPVDYCVQGNTLTMRVTSPTYTGSAIVTHTRQ